MKLLVTALAAFSLSAGAAVVDLPMPPKAKYKELYDKGVSSEVIARWANHTRKPAANGAVVIGEEGMKPSMKAIRDKVLMASTADQFEALLGELEAGYDKLDDDAKFFAAQVLAVKPLRGIAWRLRPLFETTDGVTDFFSGNRATHSTAVTMLRSVFQTTKIYVPTDQAGAVFTYAVSPSTRMKPEDQFHSVSDYQNFLIGTMLPAMQVMHDRLYTLYKGSSRPYVFDARMLYGIGTFGDGSGRYVAVDDAEVAMALAGTEGAMHSMLVFCSYNEDQLMNVAGGVGKLYGIDGFRSDKLGVTAQDRHDKLLEYKARGFLAIRKSKTYPNYGKDLMKQALPHLQAYASYLWDAHQILQNAPANTQTVLNPLFFKDDSQPRLKHGVVTMKEVALNLTTVRSPITGEMVNIDIPNFYSNPPEQMLDLLPTAFQKSETHEISVVNDEGKTLHYRDYSEGRAIAWGPEWKKIFPNLSSKQNVADAFRVIEYSSGPGILFGPMTSFIF